MIKRVKPGISGDDFYFIWTDVGGSDFSISRYLNMSVPDYRSKLIKLGGYKRSGLPLDKCGDIIFFDDKEMQEALEWVESMFMMKQLVGEDNE